MDQLKTSPSFVDDQYILAIKSGGTACDKAIMTLYGQYHKDVGACLSTLITRYKKCQCEADDLVHDSFIVMLHKIQKESPEIISVRAYWLGIARHLWLNQIKRSHTIDIVEESEGLYLSSGRTPESILLSNEKYDQLDQAISRCGSRCRTILLLWLSDYSMQEIAQQMNISGPAMARKIKHECFKKLKDFIIHGNIFGS